MKTIAKLKVRELKSELTKRNVEFAANETKAVLVEVCTATVATVFCRKFLFLSKHGG